jgi:hypothetical protein
LTGSFNLGNCFPLTDPSPPGRFGPLTWVHIVLSVAGVLYGVVGVYVGAIQMTAGLPQDEINCAYRVQLLRDRVIDHMKGPRPRSPKVDEITSTLLRETQAACSTGHPDLAPRIDSLDAQFRAHRERSLRDIQARQELLAP